MKKKILFVITKSNLGGAQKYVYDLATNLPKERFEVGVLLGGEGALIEKLRVAGIRTIPLPSLLRDVNPFRDVAIFFTLRKIFRAERPDVVHLNSAKAGGIGAFAARCAGVHRIIFTAHGWAFNEERGLLSRLLITFFSWLTVVLAHKTIAVSDAVQSDTKGWPFVHHKIITIRNGTSEPQFIARDEARASMARFANTEVTPDTFIIGTIAELHPNKGIMYAIHTIMDTAKTFPHILYLIAGDGEQREELETYIREQGFGEHIHFLGFVLDATRYLKAFDCFVLPSVKEGLPYVLLEAGLASLPIITTSVGGIPEVIDDVKTGLLVPSRDTDALTRALMWMIENPEKRSMMGSALHEKVLHDFSLSKMSTATIALYEEK